MLGTAVDRELREQEREHFLEAVSHEVRSPLTSVVGFTWRLARALPAGTVVSSEVREEIETLHSQVERLARAVDMVFQLARVDRPQALARDPVLLVPLLRDLVAEVQGLYPGIELEEEYADDTVVVHAEEAAMRTAFGNIIENAAKYSRQEPRRVRVSVSGEPSETVVAVGDSCGGLRGGELRRMFEHNYRGDERGSSAGLGIGLHLASRVCTAFGWRIDVENDLGLGCKFLITMPNG